MIYSPDGDMNNLSHTKEFAAYVNKYKPIVIVMAPPCTYLCQLAQLWGHKWKDFDAKLRNAKKLASLSAYVAFMQMKEGRHFILEIHCDHTFGC